MSAQEQDQKFWIRPKSDDYDDRDFEHPDDFWTTKSFFNEQGIAHTVEVPDWYEMDAQDTADTQAETDGGETKTAEVVDHLENGHAEPQEPDVVDTSPDPMPEVSETEQTAREIISALNQSDLNELVWNPDAKPSQVPYNPRTLVHNTITPSAKAFDLFASIIEAATDIQYSVVEWDFEETESQYRCDVIIEKQAGESTKQMVGFKTELKKNAGESAWRERTFSKARRNALQQDIPPTWIKALLDRYREVQR